MPSWYSLASKLAWFLNKTSLWTNYKWFGLCPRWEFVQYLLSTPPSSYDEHWIPVRFLLFTVVVFLLLFLVFVVCCCISRMACVTVSLNATVFVTRCQNIVLPVHFTTHGYYILRLFRYHKKPRMMALMLMVRRRSRSLPSSLGPLVWSNQGARTTTLADDITWWLCSFSWRCCDHDFDGCGESL